MVRTLLTLSTGKGSLGRVLDVGCGTGALLDQLQSCSTELWGGGCFHGGAKSVVRCAVIQTYFSQMQLISVFGQSTLMLLQPLD